jgi:CSLREA domain-containing protein
MRFRRRTNGGRRAVAALVALVLTATPWHARAATFTVNSAADTADGFCGAAVGECTLRETIESAVAIAGRDTIAFDPSVFPRGAGTNIINLASPLPRIADAAGTVVDGAGAGVFINGGNNVQDGLVFTSPPGVPPAG